MIELRLKMFDSIEKGLKEVLLVKSFADSLHDTKVYGVGSNLDINKVISTFIGNALNDDGILCQFASDANGIYFSYTTTGGLSFSFKQKDGSKKIAFSIWKVYPSTRRTLMSEMSEMSGLGGWLSSKNKNVLAELLNQLSRLEL